MKVLLVNKFFFPKGGAEVSFFETAKLLASKGHKVFFFSMSHPNNIPSPYAKYFISNVNFNQLGSLSKQIKAAGKIIYSFEAKRNIEKLIIDKRVDVVHLNNIHHQISPSILHTLKKWNLPTVMTLRDYKMACPAYSMLSDGEPCEKCRDGRYYWCLLKRCTKHSYLKSALNTLEMYLHHSIFRIYDLVDIFISPSKFLKRKIQEMGFKGEVVYLPNFIDLGGFVPSYTWEENSLVYFGRLSQEKGLFSLIKAFKHLDLQLKVIGEGPLGQDLGYKVKKEEFNNILFLGYKRGEELKREITKSIAAILPSECYENNPRSVIEAFALGKPVIGSRIGGIPELVRHGETGLTFQPGNVGDLREKIISLLGNKDKIIEMGKTARVFVEEELNPEKHYQGLMKIYERAIAKCL